MATDQAQQRWLAHLIRVRWSWRIRLALFVASIGALLVAIDGYGLAQVAAQVVLTAPIVLGGLLQMAQFAQVAHDVSAYDWSRLGHFAWLRRVVLMGDLALVLLPFYGLFVGVS
jgi:hypothetical protein